MPTFHVYILQHTLGGWSVFVHPGPALPRQKVRKFTESDVAVIREITLSLLRPRKVGFKRFLGHGCGKICRKCAAWAEALVLSGCPWIAVIHDLDEYNETELRTRLEQSLKTVKVRTSVVLIPKKEIEAWLLFDDQAIASAFNERATPRLPGNPESLSDPKKFLEKLVWKTYKKYYVNTIHNAMIARAIRPPKLRNCVSFTPHPGFVSKIQGEL
jgi:hypothetical protein